MSEIGKTPLFLRTLAVCVLHPVIPCKVAPQQSLLRFTGCDIQHVLFRFRVQRYNIFLTPPNLNGKKMQNMLYNIKMRPRKGSHSM